MNCTGIQGQTALDFYLSLSSREDPTQCRGPLVYLSLGKGVGSRMMEALEIVEKEDIVENAYICRLENGLGKFASCSAHWLDISAISYVVGASLGRADFKQIAEAIKQMVCSGNDWDYRELDNYLRTSRMTNVDPE